jgi:hypothetical protein
VIATTRGVAVYDADDLSVFTGPGHGRRQGNDEE